MSFCDYHYKEECPFLFFNMKVDEDDEEDEETVDKLILEFKNMIEDQMNLMNTSFAFIFMADLVLMWNIDKAKIKIERANKFLLVRYYKLYKKHKNIMYNNCGYDQYLTDRHKKYVNYDDGGWRRKHLHRCLLTQLVRAIATDKRMTKLMLLEILLYHERCLNSFVNRDWYKEKWLHRKKKHPEINIDEEADCEKNADIVNRDRISKVLNVIRVANSFDEYVYHALYKFMMDRSVYWYCGSRPLFLNQLLPVLEKCSLRLPNMKCVSFVSYNLIWREIFGPTTLQLTCN